MSFLSTTGLRYFRYCITKARLLPPGESEFYSKYLKDEFGQYNDVMDPEKVANLIEKTNPQVMWVLGKYSIPTSDIPVFQFEKENIILPKVVAPHSVEYRPKHIDPALSLFDS